MSLLMWIMLLALLAMAPRFAPRRVSVRSRSEGEHAARWRRR
jgi:hypothetical protein